MNRNEIIEKLRRVDEELFFEFGDGFSPKPYVVIVGGGAVMLRGLSNKNVTKDIDVFRFENAISEQLFLDPDINAHVGAFCLNMPYGFEDRIVEVDLGFRLLRVFTPSVEDLAVMKLYRWEEPDMDDLFSESFCNAIDWHLLEKLVYDPNEALASRISEANQDPEYKIMVSNFEEYKERCFNGEEL